MVPPFTPLQFHDHGPEPDTAVAVPDEQRLDDGVEVAPTPFADPHTPFCISGAEHDALVPPLAPLQFHVQGPVPDTAVAVPDEQRLELGALIVPVPFAEPHVPFTAQSGLAFEQLAFDPPPEPLQFQVRVVPQAVAPLSLATVPDEQAPGLPHTPLTTQTGLVLEQLAFDPPPEPLHVHVRVVPHAVAPLSPDGDPAEQAPPVELHAPLTAQAGFTCEQLALLPPPEPLQFQVRVVPQAVTPLSLATDPDEHAPAVELHTPLTTQTGLALEQLTFVPPPDPLQVQVRVVPQAVALLSPDGDPAEQAPPVEPHAPLTAQTGFTFEQLAFDPPPEPLQFQVRVVPQEVRPLSPDTVPAEHAPGPPHAPLMGAAHAMPDTVTGDVLSDVAPLPSWPDAPLPQHLIVPSLREAQV